MHETRGLCASGYQQIEAESEGFARPPVVERNDDHVASRHVVVGEEHRGAACDASYTERC